MTEAIRLSSSGEDQRWCPRSEEAGSIRKLEKPGTFRADDGCLCITSLYHHQRRRNVSAEHHDDDGHDEYHRQQQQHHQQRPNGGGGADNQECNPRWSALFFI